MDRTFEIRKGALDDRTRTLELAISSEIPVERWFGIEILDHASESIDLSRLNDGRHPLLVDHDSRSQIGVIHHAGVNADRILRGLARFGRSEKAEEVMQDVADDIRTHVSVGYTIQKFTEETRDHDGNVVTRELSWDDFDQEMRALYGDSYYREGKAACRAKGAEPAVYRATKWQPFEVSIVPIPADPTVGVGRQYFQPAASPAAITRGVQSMDQQQSAQAGATADVRVLPVQMTDMERTNAILNLGEAYAKYVTQRDVADFIRGQKSPEQFKDFIMGKIEGFHANQKTLDLDMTAREVRRYSFGRALQAMLTGDWSKAGFERECSAGLAQLVGRSPEGFFIPPAALARDFNVGTTTEAGNLVATTLNTDLYTDVYRNAMVLGQLGARFLPGLTDTISIPRKAAASTLGTLTEIGSASETAPTTAALSLSPKRVGAFIEVSKQALIQSAMSIEGMLRDDLLMGAAVQIEYLALNGNGTAPQHAGIRNTTGIGTVVGGTAGAAPTWAHVVGLESACANANAEPDRLAGYLINTQTRGKLKQTQFATNLPMIWQNGPQPLNGYRVAVSNNMPSNLTKGSSTTVASAGLFSSDWSMDVIGFFGAPDVTVDPYTKADTGQVKITLNQFADSGVRRPEAFAKIDDWLSA